MAPTDDNIARSTADRQSTLRRTRRLKMARSAHAYVRGSTQQFYQWLESTPATVPDGPAIWICGDCHLGNLGPLADRKGRVAIQIRDLDQTVIGSPAHDIIRLGLSLASALRGSDLPGVTTARMLEALIAGYQAALDPEASKADPTGDHPRLVQRLLTRSVRRRWPQLAEERLKGDKARIALGKRFWPLEREERAALADLLQGADVRDLLIRDTRGAAGDRIKLIDAAYWMKGCSSLGRLRYAALVKVGSGKTATTGLIDIKAAVAAAAPRAIDAVMPRDNGQRVLAGARALSPNLGERMAVGRLDGQAVTLRELAPQDLKIELSRTRPAEAIALGRYLGGVVGEAHGRQMTGADRARWTAALTRSRSTVLDAPSWLWSSVVELIGLHEAAYLEHCRQYALLEAALGRAGQELLSVAGHSSGNGDHHARRQTRF